MLAERVKTWTEEWKKQGIQQGILQGRQEGEAKLLRRQLTQRFGPLPDWAEHRIDQAGEAELESWADRIFDAQTIDDLLKHHG